MSRKHPHRHRARVCLMLLAAKVKAVLPLQLILIWNPVWIPLFLIAYFSWSGNTEQLAGDIQEQLGGDLFKIEPETPYTDNINELSGLALQEQRDNALPALAAHVEDIDQYDVVFIGYPNWWSDMPMPVFTFLEEYDFSGKP